MGTITDTAKVGLVVVIAAAVMIGGYALVRGSLFGTASTRYFIVDFENGEGVSEGTAVKIAGTNVGFIESKEFLPEKRVARIKFRLEDNIALYKDSLIAIKQEGILGSKYIDITDPPAELLSDANEVEEGHLFVGGKQTDLLAGALGEGGLSGLIPEDGIAVQFPQFFEEEGVADQMITLMQELQMAVANTNGVVLALGGVVQENRGELAGTVENFNDISESILAMSITLEDTSRQLSTMATDPARAQKIDTVLANLELVSVNMSHLTGEFDKLVSDPALQGDARESVKLLRETMQEAKNTLEAFQKTLGGVDGLMNTAESTLNQASGTLSKFSSAGEGINTKTRAAVRMVDSDGSDSLEEGDRIVGDLSFAVGKGNGYLELGAENIGEEDDLNLLFGYGALDGFSFRGGVYRSELGAGLQYNLPGGNGGVAVTVYDTHDPKVNAIGRVPVGDAVNVIVGVEDINKESKATLGVGIEL